MTITKSATDGHITFALEGRLESNTSDTLAKELAPVLEEAKHDVTLDLAKLQFVSSAGLRVIFTTHKKCKASGRIFYVTNANDTIQEIFDITGYSGI
jgi:anti-sigma B factor antagonist